MKRVLFLAAALVVAAAQAAGVASVSPQGEVAQARQVVMNFDEAVVPFGDLRQADPATLSCNGAAPAGSGRWANERTWLYDLRNALPPGSRCTLKIKADWKPRQGAFSGRAEFGFNTGGPAIVASEPYDGATVEEEQGFLLRLSGSAVEASVLANAGCEVEGLRERIPLRVIGGAARDELLRARRLDKQADTRLLVACQRPLPNDTRVRLVWGRGIAARADPKIVTTVEQKLTFTVRKAFSAEFSCERERANAPCMPIRPLSLRFSEPVARELAAQVRLRPAGGAALAPVFDKDDKAAEVSEVVFPRPLPENTRFTIELPAGVKDAAGRSLANAASFPLAVATGDAPPIAKFAAAPFGVIERDAEALLPLTLRHVQGDLRPAAAGGQVRVKTLREPAQILAWFTQLRRYHESQLSEREAGLPGGKADRYVATRELSLLKNEAGTKRLDLPQLQGGDPRPFEVVGIPLPGPGYHVVEIESLRLGQSLLDKRAPMYVRTGVLVTNLGVHFKLGRESSLAWVTTLDRAAPVAGAEVLVHDCAGQLLWQGRSDAQGIARIEQALDADSRRCRGGGDGLFVVARQADAQGVVDLGFVFSDWQQGIEPWRFNLPTARGGPAEVRAHTVFDRTLLRAGETVSMKHFVRLETMRGLAALGADALPNQVKIVHEGSGQQTTLPLQWNGARSALTSWAIPPAAKLGLYRVQLLRDSADARLRRAWDSGDFRVEEFRVPLVDARLLPPKGPVVAPQSLALAVQMNYLAGGAMANAPLRASALLRPSTPQFSGYDEFSFEPPREGGPEAQAPDEEEAESTPQREGRLVADKQPLSTDKDGAASFTLKALPKLTRPGELLAELTFNDPNGEVQTVARSVPLWPSAVVLGVKAGSWASTRGQVTFSVLALDTAGKPLAGQKVDVRGRLAQAISTRKRMVGGFYAYDNRTELKELGALCNGKTDDRGLLLCEVKLDSAGQVELVAESRDAAGNLTQSATSVWITRQGELWFAQDNDDRIDILPEKKRYEPGETARLQVRMPFREATALVAVEREGVIDAQVHTLRGSDPTLELKIDKAWGPNVYVSVLALRGRIREVPWYSFFTWGWKEPLNWVRSFWYEGREYQAPTAMVDLAKPAFKLGVAALRVGLAAHELQVQVTPDKPQYGVRQKVLARVKVSQGGQPAAGAEVAFAAVDEGLLALRDNASWQLLAAMLRERAWGVQTSTGQSEIIGRRHYGRKAVAAGGGGGRGGTRELFDTLLTWQPVVKLDANGEALVEVPLNDALTSFRLVAVADDGGQRFGTGSNSVRVTQDLQLLSGLPPLVREGDRFQAQFTLRNTTPREMKVHATLAGTVNSGVGEKINRSPLALPAQDLVLPAGAAQEIRWTVEVPNDAFSIAWEASADETSGAKDRVKLLQLVKPAVPLRVLQATLQQLDGPVSLPVAAPADALPAQGPKRGGLGIGLQPRLTGALPGLRRWFENYPFSCLEQKTSKAIGLHDNTLWAALVNTLPTYLDRDGLAGYFPPRADEAPHGSDRLTAYLLAATHEAGFELPPAARDAMLDGLTAFVQGRIERRFWSPRPDLDVRKLAAIEALSRYGRAQPKMLDSVNLTPNLWPTAALIDWLNILRRTPAIPGQGQRLAEAQTLLRARLTFSGTQLKFSSEDQDAWWWLMDSPDANAARLILAVLDDPAWKSDLPRLLLGHLGRQQRGAWSTTTANLWGSLALDKFAAKFESAKVGGRSIASIGNAPQVIDWARSPEGGRLLLSWPEGAGTLELRHEGGGKPWLTMQSLAAIPLRAPLAAGYAIARSVSAVERKDPGRWSRGDVLRVRLEIDAQADMSWVVVSDPVPAGASLLGSGLGRDSAIATRGERSGTVPSFEERGFEAWRSYHEMLPRGHHVLEYTLRLNTVGRFALPPTRVEAMYAPENFGEAPNDMLEVQP